MGSLNLKERYSGDLGASRVPDGSCSKELVLARLIPPVKHRLVLPGAAEVACWQSIGSLACVAEAARMREHAHMCIDQ